MTLDGNAVRSVDRAAALLLALGESHGEAGVTEVRTYFSRLVFD